MSIHPVIWAKDGKGEITDKVVKGSTVWVRDGLRSKCICPKKNFIVQDPAFFKCTIHFVSYDKNFYKRFGHLHSERFLSDRYRIYKTCIDSLITS